MTNRRKSQYPRLHQRCEKAAGKDNEARLHACLFIHGFHNQTYEFANLSSGGVHDLSVEPLFVREVLVDGWLGNSGFRRNVVHARAVVSLIQKKFRCRQQQRLAFAI